MPHQCTTCGRAFPDGSKEMLSGCPDCGGNKFQFKPSGASSDDQPTTNQAAPSESTPSRDGTASSDETASLDEPLSPGETSSPESPSSSSTTERTRSPREGTAADTAEKPSDADRPEVPSDADRPDEAAPDSEHVRERTDEDNAQASARSDVVSPDELDQASRDVDHDDEIEPSDPDAPDGPRPDIGELRDELNEQFESIRIVSPGKYELNLMELYDRQEYIISLQEDGRYVIEMPDAWGISDE